MKVDGTRVHRLFYPQVPLVMSVSHEGRVTAMPVVSYASVSDSPPMVAVSCLKGGFTCRLALKARSFSLCILDRTHAGAVAKLGSTSGSAVKDKLAVAGLKHRKGSVLGVPVIVGSVASLECELRSRRGIGDHVLLISEVMAARAAGSFIQYWDFAKYAPILYVGWKDGLATFPGA